MRYQNLATYLTLTISSWMASKKLDFGRFDRIVFEEAGQRDFVVINRALGVSISKEFTSFDQLSNAEQVHQYFVRKYLEGFTRFDKHFGASLCSGLKEFVAIYFSEEYVYREELASKVVNGKLYRVIGDYRFDAFKIFVHIASRSEELVEERIVWCGPSDPFDIRYRVNSIRFDSAEIRILNSNGGETGRLVYL